MPIIDLVVFICSLLGGAVALLTVITKYITPAAKKLWGDMFGNKIILDKLVEMDSSIKFLMAELSPNGGSSVRDAISRIEIRLALTSGRVKAQMNDSSIPVFETDKDGKCTYANRAFLLRVQRGFSEIEGTGWVNVIHHSNKIEVMREWNKARKGSRNFEMDIKMATPDGMTFKVHCKGHKIGTYETIGYVGFLEDIK